MGIPASFYVDQAGANFCTEGIVVSDGVMIRVQIGLQADGTYGVTLIDPNGNLILTGTGLAANTVTANNIVAQSITADRLAALLVLSSTITTSLGYPNVTIDGAGIRCYAADGTILVNIPTDGISPVTIAAQVQASSLEVTGAAQFDSTLGVSKNAVATLQAGTQPPTSAPSLSQGLPATLALVPLTGWEISGSGFYDPIGGSGGTPCFVAVEQGVGGVFQVTEWNLSDGSRNQSTPLTGWSAPGVLSSFRGITRIGTNWYLTAITDIMTGTLCSAPRATGVFNSAYVDYGSRFYETDADTGEQLGTDGTYVYLEGYATSFLTARAVSYDTTFAYQASTTLALPTAPGGATRAYFNDFTVVDDGDGNGLCFWLDLSWYVSGGYSTLTIYQFVAASGAIVANTSWPDSGTSGGGLFWDTTNWRQASSGPSIFISLYTNWTWTTASPKYWVRYSWYHSTGTTYETVVGPPASITMLRRRQLNVTTPPVPVGLAGLTDPDTCRTYLVSNATDPGATHYHLQATDSGTTRTLTTYNSGGAADGGGTPFPGGVGASLTSADGATFVRNGNGTGVDKGLTTLWLPTSADTADRSIAWDSTRKIATVGDATLVHPISPTGWLPMAFPLGAIDMATPNSSSIALAHSVAGPLYSAVLVPFLLSAPMKIQSCLFYCTDTATARAGTWRCFAEYVSGATTLTRLTGVYGTWAFTPAAAGWQESTAGTPGTILGPGLIWLAIENTSAAQSLEIGVAASGLTGALVQTRTAVGTVADISTNDLNTTLFAGLTTRGVQVMLRGQVFGAAY
jgi:hypothetical protein